MPTKNVNYNPVLIVQFKFEWLNKNKDLAYIVIATIDRDL
jgi:hypothetical protein